MEQDHLPCSCDQEVFERVWRRVMPEDRPDCPFTLGEDAAAPPAIQPPAVALPAVVHTAPAGEQAPSRPVVGEEHDVPCRLMCKVTILRPRKGCCMGSLPSGANSRSTGAMVFCR